MKSLSSGESLNVQKVRSLFLLCSFVFAGLISTTQEGGREGRRKVLQTRRRELPLVATISSNIVLFYIPGTRCGGREMEGGGSIGKGWKKGETGRLYFLF